MRPNSCLRKLWPPLPHMELLKKINMKNNYPQRTVYVLWASLHIYLCIRIKCNAIRIYKIFFISIISYFHIARLKILKIEVLLKNKCSQKEEAGQLKNSWVKKKKSFEFYLAGGLSWVR